MRRRPTAFAALPVIVLAVAGLAACEPKPPDGIGAFTPHLVNGTDRYTVAQIIAEDRALGVTLERVQQVVDRPIVGDVGRYRDAGISSQVTIKANAGTTSHALETPEAIAAFRANLTARLSEYRTPLLAVENEETVDKFYDGTPESYLTELRAAADVAKAEEIPVTNGGLPWPPMALITWNHVRITQGTPIADQFLATVFTGSEYSWIIPQLAGVDRTDPDPYRHLRRDSLRQTWRDAEFLLDHYGSKPGDAPIDYVNFHWYASDVDGYKASGYSDADALRAAVTAIRDLTGKQAVTNELGQRGTDPDTVAAYLSVLVDEFHVPWVIWFDADGIPAHGLHDDPGQLRTNGRRFAEVVGAYRS